METLSLDGVVGVGPRLDIDAMLLALVGTIPMGDGGRNLADESAPNRAGSRHPVMAVLVRFSQLSANRTRLP